MLPIDFVSWYHNYLSIANKLTQNNYDASVDFLLISHNILPAYESIDPSVDPDVVPQVKSPLIVQLLDGNAKKESPQESVLQAMLSSL